MFCQICGRTGAIAWPSQENCHNSFCKECHDSATEAHARAFHDVMEEINRPEEERGLEYLQLLWDELEDVRQELADVDNLTGKQVEVLTRRSEELDREIRSSEDLIHSH
jgi:hypothetical protein